MCSTLGRLVLASLCNLVYIHVWCIASTPANNKFKSHLGMWAPTGICGQPLLENFLSWRCFKLVLCLLVDAWMQSRVPAFNPGCEELLANSFSWVQRWETCAVQLSSCTIWICDDVYSARSQDYPYQLCGGCHPMFRWPASSNICSSLYISFQRWSTPWSTHCLSQKTLTLHLERTHGRGWDCWHWQRGMFLRWGTLDRPAFAICKLKGFKSPPSRYSPFAWCKEGAEGKQVIVPRISNSSTGICYVGIAEWHSCIPHWILHKLLRPPPPKKKSGLKCKTLSSLLVFPHFFPDSWNELQYTLLQSYKSGEADSVVRMKFWGLWGRLHGFLSNVVPMVACFMHVCHIMCKPHNLKVQSFTNHLQVQWWKYVWSHQNLSVPARQI